MMRIPLQFASAGAVVGLIVGCWRADPNHCGSNLGDASCPEGMFCSGCVREDDNRGCVPELPSPDCHIEGMPAGTDGASAGESSSTGTTPTSTASLDTLDGSGTSSSDSSSSTTGPVPCASTEDCTDPGAPFCGPSGVCVACTGTDDPDGACAGLDATAPVCVNGACVQCTAASTSVCDEQLLVCDDATNTCVSCVEHAECSSGACQLGTGRCFPPGDVVHVDGNGGQSFPNVTMAVASVGAGEHRVIVVHELDGELPYLGSVLIDQAKTVALLAAAGESPIIQGTGGNPGIRVAGGSAALYVDALEVSNAAVTGVAIDGGYAWLDRARIVGNDGGGILVTTGGELTVRNCFVGGDISDVPALEVQGSTATILYTTVGAGFGDASALTCSGAFNVDARNSLFAARTDLPEVQCAGASIDYSGAELDLAGTNVMVGNMSTTWFTAFASGDFHLNMPPIAVATTAQWELGDPPIDIDGDARPNTDGATDFAGADRP